MQDTITAERNTTINIIMIVLFLCLLLSSYAAIKYFELNDRFTAIELTAQERLSIARQNRQEFVLRNKTYDSIAVVEAQIRAAQIEDLKRKGLWH